MKFASVMTGTLNTILLTSPELYDLRTQLRDVEKQVPNLYTIVVNYSKVLIKSLQYTMVKPIIVYK